MVKKMLDPGLNLHITQPPWNIRYSPRGPLRLPRVTMGKLKNLQDGPRASLRIQRVVSVITSNSSIQLNQVSIVNLE